jgi:hypothetical protein
MLVHRPTRSRDERIDETSPIDPAWTYPASKVKTEALLRERRGSIPLVLLRIAGVYDDQGHSPFIAEQIARIFEHRLTGHLYPGMPCAGQSFLHLDDLCDAVARVVERRRTLPAEVALLLGEPEALGYDEIQHIVGCALHGEEWKTLHVPRPLAKAGAWVQNEVMGDAAFVKPWMVDEANDHYVLDISRARQLLDWEPRHSLRATLPKMADALKRDPAGWYRSNKLNPALVAWYGQRKPRIDAGHPPARDGMARHDDARSNAEPAGDTDHADHADHEDHADHMAMMEADARRTRWAHFANVGLGLWLAASPLAIDALAGGSASAAVQAVTVDRGLPSIEWRAHALALSDVASGLLIALFGALSLSRRTAWFGQWAVTGVGLWLLFAPLVFWSPSAAQYQNDMLVGALAIAFSVLVPMMPGMSMEGMMDPKVVPPGWTYCPSTGAQRLPIAALGLVGLLVARMLAAYQLGHVDHAWEPFFAGSPTDPRNGTEEIITSSVSKAWPIADGGLGALSYLLEVPMAVMGSRARWRTMPWMVTFFGILVIPLGVVSIYFIVIQPVVIGTWSTPALLTLPWTLALSTGVGALLMFTRLAFGTADSAANSDHVVGALAITVAIIATAEVARPLRFLNVLLGGWLLLAPWLLAGATASGTVFDLVAGVALIGLALPRGRRSDEHYAGWDRYVL